MILKIVAVIAVLLLIYMVFFKKRRVDNMDNNSSTKNEALEDIMVECPSCGTYVSKDEAILSNGKYYCSNSCLGK